MQIDAKPAQARQTQRTVRVALVPVRLCGVRRQEEKHSVLNFLSLERIVFQTMNGPGNPNRGRLSDNQEQVAAGFLHQNLQPLPQPD